MGTFAYLGKDNEKLINMYTVARQFRNAISQDELLIIKKESFINKIFPYIVNSAFSSEIYLKLIILMNGSTIPKKHSLTLLLEKANLKNKFKFFLIDNLKKLNKPYSDECFERDLKSISNAFEDWRYIYEKNSITISNVFLQLLNTYLDITCKSLIKNKFDINMDEYPYI